MPPAPNPLGAAVATAGFTSSEDRLTVDATLGPQVRGGRAGIAHLPPTGPLLPWCTGCTAVSKTARRSSILRGSATVMAATINFHSTAFSPTMTGKRSLTTHTNDQPLLTLSRGQGTTTPLPNLDTPSGIDRDHLGLNLPVDHQDRNHDQPQASSQKRQQNMKQPVQLHLPLHNRLAARHGRHRPTILSPAGNLIIE